MKDGRRPRMHDTALVGAASNTCHITAYQYVAIHHTTKPITINSLWFKASLKLCALLFRLKEFGRMGRVLKELHR